MINLSFKGKRFKIVDKFFIFLAISCAVILTGIIFMATVHMNVGLDFSSGAIIEVTVENSEFDTAKKDGNKSAVDTFIGDFTSWLKTEKNFTSVDNDPQTSVTGGSTTIEFRVGNQITVDGKTVDLNGEEAEQSLVEYVNDVKDDAVKHIESYFGKTDMETLSVNPHTVDNKTAIKTLRRSFIAAGVAILVILIYIMIRFTWVSAIAAVLALIHDVLIMTALTTIFRIPVNSTFIAAIVTIIGYSINATIVVFDRVRELMKTPSYDDVSDKDLANEAVTNTLSRSILTTVTTLVVIVLLAIFGNTTIHEFAFPIIFGLIAGAYSSIFLSASIWVYLRKLFRQSGKRPVRKAKKQV